MYTGLLTNILSFFCNFAIMLLSQQINALKGIHPGLFLDRELQKRKLKKGRFAMAIGEYPQTLTAITKGDRDMNTKLALKIEHELNLDEGFLMILQTFYEIKEIKEQQKSNDHPDLSKIRKAIFWDTQIEKIDWDRQKEAVIKRIYERGNVQEKEEITRFYGPQLVNQILGNPSTP